MKTLILTIILGTFGAGQAAIAQDTITLSKAAELACHRIERLVTLKKIDEAFETKFATLFVTALTRNQPSDPAFKVTAMQYPGSDGKSALIEILQDIQGKALSINVITSLTPANAPVWPDKDAITLAENSLHYVLEGWQLSNPEVKPFYTDLKSMRLSQVADSSGQVLSKAEFLSNTVTTTLEVYLKLDGSFLSAQVK